MVMMKVSLGQKKSIKNPLNLMKSKDFLKFLLKVLAQILAQRNKLRKLFLPLPDKSTLTSTCKNLENGLEVLPIFANIVLKITNVFIAFRIGYLGSQNKNNILSAFSKFIPKKCP